jgi:spermidine synthase
VIPWQVVDRAPTPDGTELVLARRGHEWEVRADRATLMSNRAHASEEALARLAFAACPGARDVLVGGLGLGYSLRAALDLLPPDGTAVVGELSPTLVEWNRTHVAGLAGRPLDDPRTRVVVGDVLDRIREARRAYDAILLDVDNGPEALVQDANHQLYGRSGIRACWEALRPGGVLSVWSLGPDEGYVRRLAEAGFRSEARRVPERAGARKKHIVFVSVRPALTSI